MKVLHRKDGGASRDTSQMAARSRRNSKRSRPGTPALLGGVSGDSSPDPDLLMLEQSDPALVYLAELIKDGKKIVFITGAGISRGSGIATYRGAFLPSSILSRAPTAFSRFGRAAGQETDAGLLRVTAQATPTRSGRARC